MSEWIGNIKHVKVYCEYAYRYSNLANFNLTAMLPSAASYTKDSSPDAEYTLRIQASADHKSLLFEFADDRNGGENLSFVITLAQMGEGDVHSYAHAKSSPYEEDEGNLYDWLSAHMQTLLAKNGLVFSDKNLTEYTARQCVKIIGEEIHAAMPPRMVDRKNLDLLKDISASSQSEVLAVGM